MEAGKYDDLALRDLVQTNALMSVVIIIGGNLGNGFSVSTTSPDVLAKLPDILRQVASNIERERAGDAYRRKQLS